MKDTYPNTVRTDEGNQMPRRSARPLPRDLDADLVKESFAQLIAGDAPSPWDDALRYQDWGHSITRIQGFELGFLVDVLRGLITREPEGDETEMDAVMRGIRLQATVHADCSISHWAGLMSIVMLTTPDFPQTVLRWRETAPDLSALNRARPRRRPISADAAFH
jgi:hypothetical protein